MNERDQSLCFTCSNEVGDPPRLNRLENGLPCPSCRDRILAYLPPALPGPGSERRKEEDQPEPSFAPVRSHLRRLEDEDADEPA